MGRGWIARDFFSSFFFPSKFSPPADTVDRGHHHMAGRRLLAHAAPMFTDHHHKRQIRQTISSDRPVSTSPTRSNVNKSIRLWRRLTFSGRIYIFALFDFYIIHRFRWRFNHQSDFKCRYVAESCIQNACVCFQTVKKRSSINFGHFGIGNPSQTHIFQYFTSLQTATHQRYGLRYFRTRNFRSFWLPFFLSLSLSHSLFFFLPVSAVG